MEEPVLEDHRQHHVDDASSEVRSVDARGVERLALRHLDPGDPLEGDDPTSAGALVDEWDVHCRVSRPVGGEPPGVGRLDLVIEPLPPCTREPGDTPANTGTIGPATTA